jgi:hypothetical protein
MTQVFVDAAVSESEAVVTGVKGIGGVAVGGLGGLVAKAEAWSDDLLQEVMFQN